MKLKAAFAIAVAASAVTGCATVTRGTTNQVQITSEPAGVAARTSLGHSCATPCALQIDRKTAFTVTYAMTGYVEQTITVNTQLAGAGAAGFAGNVLVGGLVGMGVDAATGATLEHVPNPVHAVMQKLPGRGPRVARR